MLSKSLTDDSRAGPAEESALLVHNSQRTFRRIRDLVAAMDHLTVGAEEAAQASRRRGPRASGFATALRR